MKKKVTFSDIAKYTNFSKTTISRYFNNPESLTSESRKKIEDALISLDYKENKVARSLANGKSEIIGVIIPDLFLHYYSQILNELINTYSKYNYKFLVFVANHDTNEEMNYINELMAYQIEGLIILSHSIDSKTLSNLNIPIVAVEREDNHISSVNSNNYNGALMATNLLINILSGFFILKYPLSEPSICGIPLPLIIGFFSTILPTIYPINIKNNNPKNM